MRKLIIIFGLALGSQSWQGDPAKLSTNGYLNGRFWAMLDKNQRTVYVAGFLDGTDARKVVGESIREAVIVRFVNEFFDEPATEAVPIRSAMFCAFDRTWSGDANKFSACRVRVIEELRNPAKESPAGTRLDTPPPIKP
ncbi:MAG: hypothetical protein FJW32_07630 [Acidobacteria bacterium]|nr:hypothetical protein [Acidobacteriota bacterium]